MRSGLQTLHDIDGAIAKARRAVGQASALPKRTAEALVDIRRRQTTAYDQIAKERLGLLEEGDGGELGYVDRKAEKLLTEHQKEEDKLAAKLDKHVAKIETLEAERREAEKDVQQAIDSYDKAAAAAEVKLLKDPYYQDVVNQVEEAESTVIRAGEKLELARQDETEKGTPYRKDPFFSYLQKRRYGTKKAKGWFLTKMLDGWVASISNYRETAENYRRLQAIPQRLENHVKSLEATVVREQEDLQKLEADILEREGVTALHKTSLKIQRELEKVDEKIAKAEREYGEMRDAHHQMSAGETGPYREAVEILSEAMKRVKIRDLRRLASQTTSREDDHAIEDILELARAADGMEDDQKEARKLMRKYERTLRELEEVRRRFKSRRYDAPSSVFDGNLLGALLVQVLAGAMDSKSLWRQIERAQRTVRRYSDNDFGGIDWTEGLRLPRNIGCLGPVCHVCHALPAGDQVVARAGSGLVVVSK